MKLNKSFEIVSVADDYLAIPVGDKALSFNGVVSLTEAVAYLLKHMDTNKSVEELVDLLCDEYDVEQKKAYADVQQMVKELSVLGVIES